MRDQTAYGCIQSVMPRYIAAELEGCHTLTHSELAIDFEILVIGLVNFVLVN